MGRLFYLTAAAAATATLIVLPGHAQQQPPQPAAPAAAQPPAQPDQQNATQGQAPVFRTGINFVRVDVIVSNKTGEPVADLKPGDFEVTEDGKPQAIETFKMIKLDGGAVPDANGPPRPIRTDFDEENEASRDDVRLFSIFLDDYHVDRGPSMAVRAPLERFIENQLGPSDMIGLMYPLTPLTEVRMTRDHDLIAHAIDQFLGRRFDYTPRNEFEERYARYPTQTVEEIRNQVSLSALKGLIIHMGSLKEGRKALILVSEGFTGLLPPQLRDQDAQFPGMNNPAAGNPFAGLNDPLEQSLRFFSQSDLEDDLREVWASAAKYNVAIYAVDPRGLAGSEFGIDQNINLQTDSEYLRASLDTLRELASNSDGRAIINRNDLDTGMKQIVRDSSAYYLIGYNSTLTTPDGKFHEIKVHVKRPGVQVRARKGYWAATLEDVKRATEKPKPGPPPALEAALAAVNTPAKARTVRTWIGTSRGDNGKTRVTFVWEPVAQAPGEHRLPGDDPTRVTLLAAAADGTPYFRGRVPDLNVASSAPKAAAGADPTRGPSRISFDVPPGKMELRLSVEGGASQVIDSEVREVAVPDLTAPQPTVATPAMYFARTARDMQQIKADPDAVPVATREFRRTDRLLIRVPAYGPAGAPPLTARLLNRGGQSMADLPLLPPDTRGDVQLEVPLAGLAPGEYIVEIAVKDAADAKQLVGFRVTG